MAIGKIRIESDGPNLRLKKIFLDDEDISRFVHSLTYRAAVDEVDTVDIRLVGDVEIPENVRVYVMADEDREGQVMISVAENIDPQSLVNEITRRISSEFDRQLRIRS